MGFTSTSKPKVGDYVKLNFKGDPSHVALDLMLWARKNGGGNMIFKLKPGQLYKVKAYKGDRHIKVGKVNRYFPIDFFAWATPLELIDKRLNNEVSTYTTSAVFSQFKGGQPSVAQFRASVESWVNSNGEA